MGVIFRRQRLRNWSMSPRNKATHGSRVPGLTIRGSSRSETRTPDASRREHEGAGAVPDTGHRSLGNAFPWRYLRVVRRPRGRVLRRARDKAAAVHLLAAPRRFRDLHALAGGPARAAMAYLPYVRNACIVSDLWRRR